MAEIGRDTAVLSWEEALLMPDLYAEVGKFAVAAWFRERLDALRAGGMESCDVEIGHRPDAEMSN